MMQTHDEETRRFFKHSSVHVELCLRSGKQHSWAKKLVSFIFKHFSETPSLNYNYSQVVLHVVTDSLFSVECSLLRMDLCGILL